MLIGYSRDYVSERFTMLKNSLFAKTVYGISIYSFVFALLPQNAKAWGLAPESFNRMYSMAHNGEVEGLRASVYRGLNIDSVNSRGDTGLCVAARRHDIRAYNAFRASGANPRHPCTQRIYDYEEFVSNSNAVPFVANSREAYSALGKEEYRIAPWVWWTGGALLVGGVAAAIALGGGGGGGGSSSSSNTKPAEEYKSLGAVAAGKGTVKNLAKQTDKTNNDYFEYSGNKNAAKIAAVNLNNNVLQDTNYIDVIYKATTGGAYTNSNQGKVYIKDGAIAMDAVKRSIVTNNGYINVKADNAAIGMVASESSQAINNGKSSNGIVMYYSGGENNAIIGMYADTNSTINNNGRIYGTATSGTGTSATALNGSLIAMEAMTINSGQDRNEEMVTVTNGENGTITLSAGAGTGSESESEVQVELVGIGNYLNYGFLYESKDINRAEKVTLVNDGDILLNYIGNYTSNALHQGKGGIVGIRAEVNAVATNNKNITISFNETSNSDVDATAGMLLVHGGMADEDGNQVSGILKNNGNISILTTGSNSPKNYGMLSVEGDGNVSNLYRVNPLLSNMKDGTIMIKASNSYGMATYNGGTLTNDGIITLGDEDSATSSFYSNNTAMYAAGDISKPANIINSGTININSHNSYALINEHIGSTRLVNNGTINVNKDARNTKVFGGAYSELVNEGDITYKSLPKNGEEEFNGTTPSSDDTVNAFANYKPQVGISIMETKPDIETQSSSSETENALNAKDASITIDATSFIAGIQVNRSRGQGTNNGTISILREENYDNTTDNIGMFLDEGTAQSARLLNNGTISVDSKYSAAMASISTNNAGVRNESGALIEATHDYTIGIYVGGRTIAQNAGSIIMKYAAKATEANYMTAVYIDEDAETGKSTFTNDASGIINVGEQEKEIAYGYGIFTKEGSTADIINNGTINIYTKNQGGGIWLLGTSQAINKAVINVLSDNTYGMYAKGPSSNESDDSETTAAKLINNESGVINVGTAQTAVKGSYGIYADGVVNVDNKGTINLYNDETATNRGYAIYSTGDATISNTGTINLFNGNSAAIYAGGGTVDNNADINILNNNSYGLEISGDAQITNNGKITVGTQETPVSQSYGMVVSNQTESEGSLINAGTIDVYSTGNSYGILARSSATVENKGNITAYKTTSGGTVNSVTAVLSSGENTVINTGNIAAEGAGSFAVRSNGSGSKLTLENGSAEDTDAQIVLGKSGDEQSGGAAISAGEIDTITNYASIMVYNNNATAIAAQSGTSITNETNAEINISGNDGTGINGGTVTDIKNNGEIILGNGNNNRGIVFGGSGTVENAGSITIGTTGSEATQNYGIYATAGTITNGGTIAMNSTGSAIKASNSVTKVTNQQGGEIILKYSYNYGINAENGIDVENSGTITVIGLYSYSTGIYASNSSKITNKGTININALIHNYGIQTSGSVDITNDTSGIINVYAPNSYGIYAINRAKNITNNGYINVYGNNSYGIYAVNPENVTNNGHINVDGNNSYGIWVEVTEDNVNTPVNIENKQTINVSGSNSYAIYVQKDYVQGTEEKTEGEETKTVYSGDNTTVTDGGAAPVAIKAQTAGGGMTDWHEPGTEVITGLNSPATAHSLIFMPANLQKGVRLVNSGIINSDGAVDFGDGSVAQGQNVLSADGQYVADSFSGTVVVDTAQAVENFATTQVNENAFVGEDNGIDVVSDSYMFTVNTERNSNGNTNVVTSLRSFNAIAPNNNTASFLKTNYAAGQGATLFQALGATQTQAQFIQTLNRSLGLGVMPNFVKQNRDTERTLNKEINDDIMTASAEKNRARFKALHFNSKVSGQHNLSGYDNKTTAVYGFSDFALSDMYSRAGLGLAVARSYAKFDDSSKRYNNMVEVFAPLTYQRNDSVIMLKPKGGFARGHYRRFGADKRYKGNNEEYYYGINTGAKHSFDLGIAEVEPNVGVNVTGMYVDSVHESNGGLKIKAKNVVSTQSAMGIDVAKNFELNNEQSLRLKAGGKYYHEFGEKYRTKATIDGMTGGYDMIDERFERDFGLLSLKADYQYNQFSVGAEAHAPIEHNNKPYYLLNIGYKF